MDQFISWSLALTAVVTFIGSLILDHFALGTDFPRSARLLMYGAVMLSIGTFVVSTLVITGNPGGIVTFAAAFNRAILAGIGCTVFARAWRRFQARPRVR